jgi:hypothetical protein
MPTPVAEPARRGLWPAFLAVAIGSVAFTLCTARDEPRELDALPPADRARVLEQTLENLALCGRDPAPELREFCAAEAARAERAGVHIDHGRAAAWRSSR